MNLRDNIKKVLNESSGKIALQIEKLLNKKVKERYPRFICRIEVVSPGNESFYASGEKTRKFIVRVVFKPLPDGEWVARGYADKAMDECWDWVYNFMGIAVDLYSKHDSNCGEDSMIGINESLFLKRRVGPELIETGIKDALDYVSDKFYNKRSSWYRVDPEIFRRIVINILMDHIHPTISNWGTEDFPYDEVYDYLTDYYSKRILERYKELDENPPTQMETNESEITERCWKGYTQKGMKTMFGKRYPNCVKKTKK
jgi:hypothetical protein